MHRAIGLGIEQLTVRIVDGQVVAELKARAAANGRSAEAEHRLILRQALLPDRTAADFFVRAAAIRRRLPADLDTTALIRTDRDRDDTR